jgi:hypothetical protein
MTTTPEATHAEQNGPALRPPTPLPQRDWHALAEQAAAARRAAQEIRKDRPASFTPAVGFAHRG